MTKLTDFKKQMASYTVFSLRDIYNVIPDFNYRQLNRWKQNGSLKGIRRGFYHLNHSFKHDYGLMAVANKIYKPSYVSLETVFQIYNFIPELVFQITSVSTNKTNSFESEIANFSYKKIKHDLFFGYRLVEFDSETIFIAEREKAILDYLYLKPHFNSLIDFKALRFDKEMIAEAINLKRFNLYTDLFNNKALKHRVDIFLKYVKDND